MTIKRDWEALDGSKPSDDPERKATIPQGTHEMDRIPNPYGYDTPWLVLKGTKTGATEGSWRQWSEEKWDDFQVVIEES